MEYIAEEFLIMSKEEGGRDRDYRQLSLVIPIPGSVLPSVLFPIRKVIVLKHMYVLLNRLFTHIVLMILVS